MSFNNSDHRQNRMSQSEQFQQENAQFNQQRGNLQYKNQSDNLHSQIFSEDRMLTLKTNSIIRIVNQYMKIIYFVAFVTILLLARAYLIRNYVEGGEHANLAPWKINSWYDLVILQSKSALCLDGSPAGYYISEKGDPSKILLFFQGGGWCGDANKGVTLENCYQRTKTGYGTSIGRQNKVKAIMNNGILSIDQNNYFKDWKKVFIFYCDGSGHQGTRKQPIRYNGIDLYFRGHNITVQTLQQLQLTIGLFSRAQKVVISGTSAGGLAAILWTNYIVERVERVKNAKVWTLPDSGIFLDSQSLQTRKHSYRQVFKNLLKISNIQIDSPVSQCVIAFPNQKQNCMFAQHILKYIKAPIFLIQSLYDSWSIFYILNIKCLITKKQDHCSDEQIRVCQDYRKNASSLILQIGNKQGNGYWAPARSNHGYTQNGYYSDKYFWVSKNLSISLNEAIGQWIDNQPINHRYIDIS